MDMGTWGGGGGGGGGRATTSKYKQWPSCLEHLESGQAVECLNPANYMYVRRSRSYGPQSFTDMINHPALSTPFHNRVLYSQCKEHK